MANTDAPTGFRPLRHLTGGIVRFAGGYTIASAYATSIFQGDLVSLAATRAERDIELTADGAAGIIGVFAGCQYTASDGSVIWTNQWVGGTATKGSVDAEAFIYTDPYIVYEAQVDGTLAATAAGQFIDMVSTHAGNTSTGISGEELDSTTEANTILQLKLLGPAKALDGISDTDLSSDHSRWEVVIAEGELAGTYQTVA